MSAKRRNEFRHFISSARVWLRNARACRSMGLHATAADFIAKARADRAIAIGWLA